jgi:peptidylamidoglycolate lyase
VIKSDLNGNIILELNDPRQTGAYGINDRYAPTETAIEPTGDIYAADGYGSQYVSRFSAKGEFVSKFGGDSFLQEKNLSRCMVSLWTLETKPIQLLFAPLE